LLKNSFQVHSIADITGVTIIILLCDEFVRKEAGFCDEKKEPLDVHLIQKNFAFLTSSTQFSHK